MSATLKTITLGCKVNQYETELVREGLRRAGYQDAAEDQAADLCVVNTCTVTAEGDSKSRHVIRKLARVNPTTRIVVMGCYATRAPEEVAALPNVAEVVTDKREIPDLLQRFGVIDIPTGISRFTGRKRAYVKVQDGCLLRCSYCIIPHVRPNVYSRPVEHIRDEVARLVDNGHREIILTGVHLGHFGVEQNHGKPREEWIRLATLVRELCRLPGEFRIRLSSIEATEVTRDLISVLAENPTRIAPHLHICLQSGSDAVLRRMKRRWGSKLFVDRCRLVRESLDQPGLSTDVIVGFPGETEEDFAATCQVVRDCGFAKVHIFPFSGRKGTPAYDFPDQIPHEMKQQRLVHLQQVEAEVRDEYFRSLLGRTLQVMVEGESEYLPELSPGVPDGFAGTSCRYAPVEIEATGLQPSTLVDVVGHRVADGRIIARLASS
ncbi:tRNA (N(6)-L-threonylcarbamoyladenosine(37)-C(2))-methylthiotransferase MtaB [Anatilimnocola floriformis]|uniref:tRNA (N(6)-L-threonylcarbamoyladenosine(37)-C(2))- methylthiotransferase MtaB n=1 Tax=Anatilimnocola floriformis TaxID=2948575 RepID=UPI0020C52561|nr:tRNA (N(6)-L-threonylcarbamoyladenosine(37)-C(2))-methylthiotransferase MtaB [Anatilimnocola floriformis]